MLTWKELEFDEKFSEVIIGIYDGETEVITFEISWYEIWDFYELEDGTFEDYFYAQKYQDNIINAINSREDYEYNIGEVKKLAEDIIQYYKPKIMEEVPLIAYQLKLKTSILFFSNDEEFIDFTIEWIVCGCSHNNKNQHDVMTGYGFVESINKEINDEKCQSHWEGNIDICIEFWKREKDANLIRNLNFKENKNEK